VATSGTVPLVSSELAVGDVMFTFWKLLVIAVLVVAGVVVLFGLISALAGILWTIVKLALLAVIVVAVALWLLRKK